MPATSRLGSSRSTPPRATTSTSWRTRRRSSTPELTLHLYCDWYDRLQPLLDGRVQPEGFGIEWTLAPIEESLRGLLTTDDFDGGEMSLSGSLIDADGDRPAFVPLPLFTSRVFRQSSLFVRTDSPLMTLEGLRGKRIGVRNYHRATAAVWIRGLLQHEHGISPHQLTWVLEQPADGTGLKPPAGVPVEQVPEGRDLEQLLLAGEIDVLLALRMPEAFRDGKLRRLLPDSQQQELASFHRTGIFPIMHNLVLRRQVHERNPWIGPALCQAFEAAKELAFRHAYDVDASHFSLAWHLHYVEQERQLLGPDAWAYGLDANRAAVDTFARYCHEQGSTKRLLTAESLFAEVSWSPSAPSPAAAGGGRGEGTRG